MKITGHNSASTATSRSSRAGNFRNQPQHTASLPVTGAFIFAASFAALSYGLIATQTNEPQTSTKSTQVHEPQDNTSATNADTAAPLPTKTVESKASITETNASSSAVTPKASAYSSTPLRQDPQVIDIETRVETSTPQQTNVTLNGQTVPLDKNGQASRHIKLDSAGSSFELHVESRSSSSGGTDM